MFSALPTGPEGSRAYNISGQGADRRGVSDVAGGQTVGHQPPRPTDLPDVLQSLQECLRRHQEARVRHQVSDVHVMNNITELKSVNIDTHF